MNNKRVPIKESLRIKGSIPYFGSNGIQGYVKGFTHNGEFILISEDGANDIKNYPIYLIKGKIWVNNHTHVLEINKKMNNSFVYFFLKTLDFLPFLAGVKRYKLNSSQLNNIYINTTTHLEQSNISGILLNIDSLITLHHRELKL